LSLGIHTEDKNGQLGVQSPDIRQNIKATSTRQTDVKDQHVAAPGAKLRKGVLGIFGLATRNVLKLAAK
jgi:hypothetical protein